MTLNEISNTIRETAAAHGFITRDTDWHKIPEIVSDELNFTIHEDLTADEIRRGAELVNDLKAIDLSITEKF